MTRWLTSTEAAAHLRMSRFEVTRRAEAGALPGHQPTKGARWRFDADELDAYVRGEWSATATPRRKRRTRAA